MACLSHSHIQKVTPVILLIIGLGDQKQEKDFYKNTNLNRLQNQSRRQKASFNSSAPVLTSVFTCKLQCSTLKHNVLVFLYRKQLQNISVCTCSTLVLQHQVHMLTMFKYTEDDFREIFFLLKSGLWKFVCSTCHDKVTFLNKKQLSY